MKYQSYCSKLEEELKKLSIKHNLKLFIVFGSRQNNKFNLNSDWDFAFYPDINFNYKNEIKLFNDLQNILKFDKIDLLNIKTSNNLVVINNIFQTGTLVYEKIPCLFTNKKWSAFIDLEDFKRYYELRAKLDEIRLKNLEV